MVRKYPIKISKRTLENLGKLQALGFTFEPKVQASVVPQFYGGYDGAITRWPAGFGTNLTFTGTDPDGNSVEYHRKETRSKAAGQTYLKTPYGNIQVYTLLSLSADPKMGHSRYGRTSKRAYDHYKELFKSYKSPTTEYYTTNKIIKPKGSSTITSQLNRCSSPNERKELVVEYFNMTGEFPPLQDKN